MINLDRETPVTVGEVATTLGVEPRTVQAWFCAGLEWVRARGSVYTTNEAIQRFAHEETLHFRTDHDEVLRRLTALSFRSRPRVPLADRDFACLRRVRGTIPR